MKTKIDRATGEKTCVRCGSWMDLNNPYSNCQECRDEIELEVDKHLLEKGE